MPDSVPAPLGGHTAIELRGKPDAPEVYASECLSHGEAGKTARGQSWSPTGLAKCDCPGVATSKRWCVQQETDLPGQKSEPCSLDGRIAGWREAKISKS